MATSATAGASAGAGGGAAAPASTLRIKALILVGGFGTRLRPLTFTKPKPLVEFCNKPIVLHQIEALARVGVKQIILAINYQPEDMYAFIEEVKARFAIDIICSKEEKPLGTAGPLGLARRYLSDCDYFFVFNSDITCNYPLSQLLAFHQSHGGEGTIMVTHVNEPSKYGVVVFDPEKGGVIEHFVEKPTTFVSAFINAGLYIFNPSVLDRIDPKEEGVAVSMEKQVFEEMTAAKKLHALAEHLSYWMDIGQPPDYLTGMRLHLRSLAEHAPHVLKTGPEFVGSVMVHETAVIGKGCKIGPDVVIGAGCVIEDGVRIQGSTLLGGSRARCHAVIKDSIIGWHSTVGEWAHVDMLSVFGEHVEIAAETAVLGAKVLPHKAIKANIIEPGKIVM